VVGDHARVVHLVDVVARQHHHVFRPDRTDDVEVLEHRVRGAAIPVRAFHPLLRGPQVDELAEFAAQKAPAALQMAQQRVRLVLRDDRDAPNAGVQAVGEGEVDDPVLAAEVHGRLDAFVGKRAEPRAPSAREDDGEGGALQIVQPCRSIHVCLLCRPGLALCRGPGCALARERWSTAKAPAPVPCKMVAG
jgi:hypothetical protein